MKTAGMWMLVAVVTLCVSGIALAQDAPAQPERRTRRQRTPEEMQKLREQWRQRMQDAMRERLGATKEEWQILSPMIVKVQTLQRQVLTNRFRGMFGRGRRRGRGGRGRGEGDQQTRTRTRPERVLSETQKKAEALRKLLEAEKPDANAIKTALAELRAAREKARQAVVAAQKLLQSIVTVPQEARLVMMGLLP